MNKKEFNDALLEFLDASPTPFHATDNMAKMLENAGFKELKEEEDWKLQRAGRYYLTRNDSSIIAFTYPETSHYLMLGAHTDSPNLKLKPNPLIKEHGVIKFSVEPYGGLLLNPWFDRDLSLAGKISYLNTQNKIEERLIDVQKPIAVIPSLAIHLDKQANKNRTVNKQTDISPILSCSDTFEFEDLIRKAMKKNKIDTIKELYAWELSLYDTQKASYVGVDEDFIASARLDNLLSCYISLLTMCVSDPNSPMLFIASDHEEVGSRSSAGAAGSFLENTLTRIFPHYDDYMRMIRTSIMISTDNAHALHPNYADRHDKNHAPLINRGTVIKVNSNQKYASSITGISKFIHVAKSIGEPYQRFVTRSDMGCGSTIGPITATRIGIETLDIGLPTFAMHSIRELAGTYDAYSLWKILTQWHQYSM